MRFSLAPFEPVGDRAYVAVAEPASVNIGLVVGTTGALLVDTGSSPAQGAEIAAAASEIAGDVPLTHVVVTHAHYDHLYGLAGVLGASGMPGSNQVPGSTSAPRSARVESIAHRNLAALLESGRPSAEELERFGMTDADLVVPARTYSLALSVDLGDCHAEVVHFGRGHTDHDSVVIIPERGVVFAGDLLESAQPPVAGPDAWPAEWPKTLDGTLGTLRRHVTIIPGHGPAMSQTDAFIQRAEIAWLNGKAEQLHDAGSPAEGSWTPDAEWPWPQQPGEEFVAQALRRLEASGRPRKRSLPLLSKG